MEVLEARSLRETRTAEPVTVADVLTRAADLLEEFGWCKFRPAEDDCGKPTHVMASTARGFCLLGAICRAEIEYGSRKSYGGDWDRFPLGDVAHRWRPIIGVADFWNDDPGRTKAEVVAKLREAAERAS